MDSCHKRWNSDELHKNQNIMSLGLVMSSDEAYVFIKNMFTDPNAAVWSAVGFL